MFNLPAPARYRLDRPPLAQALTQIRFDLQARLTTLEGIAPVQERLNELFPYMESVREQRLDLVLGPGGAAVPPQLDAPQQSWRFTDGAGWTLVVSPHEATLAVGSEYESVDEITGRFRAVIGALVDGLRIRRCLRLGVRYINLIDLPPDDDELWPGWLRPDFVGWVGGDLLTAQLVASVSQTQVAAPADEPAGIPAPIQGFIRHGLVPANTVMPGLSAPIDGRSYLVDIDLFVEAPQVMSEEELGRQFVVLHGHIDRFFRWTLTPAGEERFGLREVPE